MPLKMSQDLFQCGSVNALVYLLVILFGISSWVDINGLWVELPVLVQNLPEGWDLPSYMAVIIQISNIAPLVYTVSSTLWPHRMIEIPVIYIIISLGGVACLLLAFLWDVTSEIAGREHSTALFVLQFCLGLVDCTSSVAFLPFMSLFKPHYMTAYFIGEGFSGLIPSLVALGQGAGSMECVQFPHYDSGSNSSSSQDSPRHSNYNVSYINASSGEDTLLAWNQTTPAASFSTFPMYQQPKFSVRTFFLFLMCLMICSGVAFTLLNYWSYCKSQYAPTSRRSSRSMWRDQEGLDIGLHPVITNTDHIVVSDYTQEIKAEYQTMLHKTQGSNGLHDDVSIETSSDSIEEKKMSQLKYGLFLVLTAWLNGLSNGVLPSLQTYSCLPYGIQPYHLAVTLSSIANPLACFASFFLRMTTTRMTVFTTILSTGLAFFIISTAAMSPEPPLSNHSTGPFVLILCWVMTVFLMTYTKVSMATVFRGQGKKALLWIGASTQAGSLAGAIAIFVLINVYKIFTVGNPCI